MIFGIKSYAENPKNKVTYNTEAKKKAKAKRVRKIITQSELFQEVSYNSLTGDFIWLRSKNGRSKLLAQSVYDSVGHEGYHIKINGIRWEAHKMAWLYMTGEYPEIVRHKDGNRFNNKFENLYASTRSEYIKDRNKHYGYRCGKSQE